MHLSDHETIEKKAADLADTVRSACRALARAKLLTAYGHCSARLSRDHFLVGPPKPPGNVKQKEACTIVSVDGDLPAGVLGEVIAHQHIYRHRADVGGICRFYSESLMRLSLMELMPRSRDVFSAYFAPAPALWKDSQLLRTDGPAGGVASALGNGRAIVLRGNGAIAVGRTLPQALFLAWALDQAGRCELDIAMAGATRTAFILDEAQSSNLARFEGREVERLWDYLTFGDDEGSEVDHRFYGAA
jgi:HCOMODA/2-hydroxy-3-carboxy-muconic semialdehyde decarboxylase